VFNSIGQSVSVIVDELQAPGWHVAHFDGSGLSSGVYFCQLQAGSFGDTKKLLLVK
jgi:hypothetical protein